MEVNSCNIQVLLQAAEYLERKERGNVISRAISSSSLFALKPKQFRTVCRCLCVFYTPSVIFALT